MNRIEISGKITSMTDLNTTPNSHKVRSFYLENTNTFGERETSYKFKVSAWDEETKLLKTLRVGDNVLVIGRLRKHKENNKYVIEIILKNVVRIVEE